MRDTRSFSHLVIIGASAGGIEALSGLVSTLPEDFPAPIVAVQHLDPNRESHLKEILERHSTLPVRTLGEHTALPLESGVIFVVPADWHVNLSDSEIFLQADSAGRPKPSIDLIFSSAAEMYGDRLIAVVLTGTGHDGADGARAVKWAGGTVIIQNPETATHPDMPRSLAPNTVDIVANLERIGPILHELLAGLTVPAEPDEKKKLEPFLEEVRNNNGIDFRAYKTPTIMRRLQRRIVATDSRDLDGYTRYLSNHPEEYEQLVSSFLIKVTEFFRDDELFVFLQEELIPQLVEQARKQDNQLRIWSAGCATGEEAYSLAILIAEALGDGLEHFNVRIFATDIDEEAIEFARRGAYSRTALSGLPENLIDRYFTREDDNSYQIRKRVRGMIVFGQHDLVQRAPFPRVDLVLCRNVLIYFTTELQRRALQLFAFSLKDGAYLILGKSETVSPLGDYFSLQNKKHKVYRRKGERFLMPPVSSNDPTPLPRSRPIAHIRPSKGSGPIKERRETREMCSVRDDFLLRFPVGVVVVDHKYDILSLNAAARRFLSINDPAVGEDLLHVVRGAHYAELRAAIDTAFKEGRTTGVARFETEEVTTGEQHFLQLTCYPQKDEDGENQVSSVMVIVSEITDLVHARQELEERLEAMSAELDQVRREAQEQREHQEAVNLRLVETNRQLTEANQELTSLNEELQTTNEQYLVTSEETQAATEEVETLNEELQATNEELETLNEELQATIEELNTTNEDLHARSQELQEYAQRNEEEQANLRSLLQSFPDAVIAVDAAGRVLFTSETFERTFGSIETQQMNLPNFVPLDENGERLPSEETPLGRAARGESFSMEFPARTADDTERRFEATGCPLRGSQQGGIVVIREVAQ